MSRMRQIPIMDVSKKEKILQQNQPIGRPPTVCVPRSMCPNCRPRTRKISATKFRLTDAPALISNGCSSVREFCNSVQHITVDLNQLIGSVENMVPLLNLYLTTMQNRSIAIEDDLEPPIDLPSCEPRKTTVVNQPEPTCQACHSSQQNHTAINPPKPEDIQQLLENPLVRNLLNGFIQNNAFPNAGATKGNALNQ